MQTVITDAHPPEVEPETDTVSVAVIGRFHRWSRSISPSAGKGSTSGVLHNSMRASTLPRTGVPRAGGTRRFAKSIRVVHAPAPCFWLERHALRRVTVRIAA